MTHKKKVLLVSAVFPPQLGGTSEKMAKRAKYFARFGWHTVVLAPQIPETDPLDRTLLNNLEHTTVHRTKYLFHSRWPSLRHDKNRAELTKGSRFDQFLDMLFVPKGFIRWLPYAIREGLKLARSVDAILTMNNPISLHIIGYILHKLTGKPWIAELRDPIVDYAYGRRGPETLNYLLEKTIIQAADHVIQREDGTPDIVSKRYPEQASKFTVIPYAGFDPDDFSEYAAAMPQGEDQPLTIVYTGSFYGDTITPIPFLKGFKDFVSKYDFSASQLQVVFAGDWHADYDQLIAEEKLTDYITYKGRITRQDCLDLWETSHVLLLILGNEEDNLLRVPSKFWDYLGAQRAMFALVDPKGRVAEIVHRQHLGVVADCVDPADISKGLADIWNAYQNGKLAPQPEPVFFSQATREMSEKMTVDSLELILANAAS